MLYPLFVNLEGKRCVVIGAGSVAERRIAGLLRTGADIFVVAPHASQAITNMAEQGAVTWIQSEYDPAQIDSALLVIAATNRPDVNRSVTEDALAKKQLVCNAGDPELGNYITGASIDRGTLQIVITTSGASPTLTAALRARLEDQFGTEWSVWTDLFEKVRAELKLLPTEKLRRLVVDEILVNEQIVSLIRDGRIDAAVEAAAQCILSHLD